MTMTYQTLVTRVKAYLDRADESTITQIPNFIDLAVGRIWRELQDIGLETYVVANFTINEPIYAKPARWRRTLNINFGYGSTDLVAGNNRRSLQLRTYEYMLSFWPNRATTGSPLFYADYGFYNFIIAPTPPVAYPFEISYIGDPPALTSTENMNWLTNYAPDVLLYATLLEAMPYLKDDERIPAWKDKYETGIRSLTYQDERRDIDKGAD